MCFCVCVYILCLRQFPAKLNVPFFKFQVGPFLFFSILHRIAEYKSLGLDKNIVDPDHGVNIEAKIQRLKSAGHGIEPLCSVPKNGWVSDLS